MRLASDAEKILFGLSSHILGKGRKDIREPSIGSETFSSIMQTEYG